MDIPELLHLDSLTDWDLPKPYVYIGAGNSGWQMKRSKWANKYVVPDDGDFTICAKKYAQDLFNELGWLDQLRDRFSSGHRRKVVTIDGGARAYSRGQDKAEELDEIDFVESEVDPILDKISEKGIQSLTERERKILEQARKKMRR